MGAQLLNSLKLLKFFPSDIEISSFSNFSGAALSIRISHLCRAGLVPRCHLPTARILNAGKRCKSLSGHDRIRVSSKKEKT